MSQGILAQRVAMNNKLTTAFVLPLLFICNIGSTQKLTADILYVKNGHERQIIDIYTSEKAVDGRLLVMFWIHGGGW